MLINVTGCTADEAMEALGLLDGVVAFEVMPATPEVPKSFFELPKAGSSRQKYLLHFIREGRSTRERARQACGDGSTYGGQEARVIELVRGGWLAETDEEEVTASGRKTGVLVASEKAKRAVKLAPTKWFPASVRIDPS